MTDTDLRRRVEQLEFIVTELERRLRIHSHYDQGSWESRNPVYIPPTNWTPNPRDSDDEFIDDPWPENWKDEIHG
jgi:hypothetical protein